MRALVDFDIRFDAASGETRARWARGSRLQLESGLFEKAVPIVHPRLGNVQALGGYAAESAADHGSCALVRAEFDLQPGLELAGGCPEPGYQHELRHELTELITWCTNQMVGPQLADALLERAAGPIASQRSQLPQDLVDEGWNLTELWLLTSTSPITVPRRVPWCRRCAKIAYRDDAVLIVWHPLDDEHDWSPEPGHSLVIPLPECHRRHSYLADISGRDGPSHVGRLIQDVLQHHEWTRWQVTEHVESWERRFFSAARAGTFFEGIEAEPLGIDLDEVHMLVVELRKVNRDLDRRAHLGWLPNPPITSPDERIGGLDDEIGIRSARIAVSVDLLNGSLREGWTLLAGAATGAQLDLQRRTQGIQLESQGLQQRFQNAATLITSLILVPGLIVSLYGANVTGLPGYDRTSGLLYVGLYTMIGAVTTGASLKLLQSRRGSWAGRALLMGIVAIVVVTLIAVHA
jgi:hypothetical protein